MKNNGKKKPANAKSQPDDEMENIRKLIKKQEIQAAILKKIIEKTQTRKSNH